MKDLNMEEIIFTIIASAGEAKSFVYEAIEYGQDGDFDKANESLEKANEAILKAHGIQSDLITREVNGEKIDVSMLFVHSQDHISSAIELKNLASYLINMLKRIDKLERGE